MTLNKMAVDILNMADPYEKVSKTFEVYEQYHQGEMLIGAAHSPPDNPARAPHPILQSASKMPKRSTGIKGKIGLVHAIAHIELNAINLAWDMIARFGTARQMPKAFFEDWLEVAYDEAYHFSLLSAHLEKMGIGYGDLPAHNGLWEAAYDTRHNFGARLAVVPMVLEARGLDVTPKMIRKFENIKDDEIVSILKIIYQDEINHVYMGVKWFEYVEKIPIAQANHLFHDYLKKYFKGGLIPPFNIPARDQAKMPRDFYCTKDTFDA